MVQIRFHASVRLLLTIWTIALFAFSGQPALAQDPLSIVLLHSEESTPFYETSLQGRTEPGAAVRLYVDGRLTSSAAAGEDGGFLFTGVPLQDGENELLLVTEDGLGRRAERSLTVRAGRFTRLRPLGFGEVGLLYENTHAGGSAGMHADAAFHLEGTVAGRYELEAAYDSRRPLNRWLAPSADSAWMGDASRLLPAPASEHHAFLRVESDFGSFLWGDYQTPAGGGEFGAFQRKVTGPLLTLRHDLTERSTLTAQGFYARAEHAAAVDLIPADGTTGFYELRFAPVVRGSESIALLTLDPAGGPPLRVQPKTRDLDYVIDYEHGRILFKSPVPSHDFDLNPIAIEVRYEHFGGGAAGVAGGRLAYEAASGLRAGLLWAEETGKQPFRLQALEARHPVGRQASISLEAARSSHEGSGGVEAQGNAAKAAVQWTPLAGTSAAVEYKRTDGGFSVRPGQATGIDATVVSTNASHRLATQTALRADAALQLEEGPGRDRRTTRLGLQADQPLGRFTVSAGVRRTASEERAAQPGRSATTQLRTGVQYAFSERFSAGAAREWVSRTSDTAALGSSGKDGTTSLHAQWGLDSGTALQAAWHIADSGGTAASLGIEQAVSGENNRTRLSTRFSVSGLADEWKGEVSAGVDSRWQARPDLALDVRYDRRSPADLGLGQADSPLPVAEESQSFSAGAEWTPQERPYRLGARYERAQRPSGTRNTFTVQGFGEAMPGLSGRLRYSLSLLSESDEPAQDVLFETVYRPRYGPATFLSLTHRLSQGPAAIREPDGSGSDPLGWRKTVEQEMELSRRITQRITLGGRLARRMVHEDDGITDPVETLTRLAEMRADLALAEAWGLTGGLRHLSQPTTDTSALGTRLGAYRDFGPEGEWRVSAGYQHQESQIEKEPWNWQTGPYLRLAVKF